MLSFVVAMSENRVIGYNNQLPWHLPNDLKHFKALTMGKTIVMGRKTHESIGKALPGRTNVILSANQTLKIPGCQIVHHIDEITDVDSEKMIIGGATLYEQFLDKVNTIYLTKVHANILGDKFFPELNSDWIEVESQRFEADLQHAFAYSFIILRKKIEGTHVINTGGYRGIRGN